VAGRVLVKREIDADGGMREYLCEDREGSGRGRPVLEYDNVSGVYSTYEWSDGRVTVKVYTGGYTTQMEDGLLADVTEEELVSVRAYDHNGETGETDVAVNGWVIRERSDYSEYTTELEGRKIFDTEGRLAREEEAGSGVYTTYTYHAGGAVHLAREYTTATYFLTRFHEYDEEGNLIGVP
jgi:hypothetical protein